MKMVGLEAGRLVSRRELEHPDVVVITYSAACYMLSRHFLRLLMLLM
jgi:hypothetical protein